MSPRPNHCSPKSSPQTAETLRRSAYAQRSASIEISLTTPSATYAVPLMISQGHPPSSRVWLSPTSVAALLSLQTNLLRMR